MEGLIPATCLDDGRVHYFSAKTPYEALNKMVYTLNIGCKDDNATINKTESNLHLYVEHSGKMYAVRL